MLLATPAGAGAAVPAFDVYVLAIGSSAYAPAESASARGFGPIDGANNSARTVADLLAKGGARGAVVLTSTEDGYVSRADMEAALKRVEATIRKDRPKAPLLVVYVAAHGISDGFAWNQFSLPGDFTYPAPLEAGDDEDPGALIERLSVEALARDTLHAATLVDRLKRSKTPYLLLLDTCYSGRPRSLDSPVLSEPGRASIASIAAALRYLNEFHQADPVLFSTSPGTEASTVPNPEDPGGDPVAPLARRLILVSGKALAKGEAATLGAVVDGLRSPGLDSQTTPAVTFAEPAAGWRRILLAPGRPAGPIEAVSGTATHARLCCQAL